MDWNFKTWATGSVCLLIVALLPAVPIAFGGSEADSAFATIPWLLLYTVPGAFAIWIPWSVAHVAVYLYRRNQR